jgi:hypothetical protein
LSLPNSEPLQEVQRRRAIRCFDYSLKGTNFQTSPQ